MTEPLILTLRRLLKSAGNQASGLRRSLLQLAVAALLQGLALGCLLPLLPALISADYSTTVGWLIVMLLLSVASTSLRWRAQGFDYHGHMAHACHVLRCRLGEQLRRMPLEQLQSRRAGELNATLLGNVDENLNYVLTVANLIFTASVTPLTVSLLVLACDWRLGLLMVLLFPVLLPLYRRRRRASSVGMQRLAAAHQASNAAIIEYLQGLPVLRAACATHLRLGDLQRSFAQLQQVQSSEQRSGTFPKVLIASLVELSLLLVAGLGIHWVTQGSLTVALLAAVLVILVRITESLSALITYTAIIDLIAAALQRIDALLAIEALPQQPPSEPRAEQGIRFEQVDFRYSDCQAQALQQIDAYIPANSLTALVGPSGSGKSTLTKLLMRHADVSSGRILIDGADIRSLPVDRLAGLLSVVFQDVYLFDDSVLENVRMAKPEASDDEVRAALQAAQCSAFVERLAQGWHTPLGELGGRLSGGERQRLSIARALLKNAPIVVLDEPTASLDSESERAVQRAIDTLVRDRTVIVIAHRLSTVVGAGQILVLDEGRIIQRGSHAQLLEQRGRYRDMWQAQQAIKAWNLGSTMS